MAEGGGLLNRYPPRIVYLNLKVLRQGQSFTPHFTPRSSVLDGLISRRVSETNEFAKGQFLNGTVWGGRNDNIGATRARLARWNKG